MLPWHEHPAARAEYLDAIRWYEEHEPTLGARLAGDLDACVDFVRAWPEAAPLIRGRGGKAQIRRRNAEVFPYGIIYLVRDGHVIVVAYAHEKRRPGYWRKRLNDL